MGTVGLAGLALLTPRDVQELRLIDVQKRKDKNQRNKARVAVNYSSVSLAFLASACR